MIGYDMAKGCAAELYKKPASAQTTLVVELRLLHHQRTFDLRNGGLCPEGGAEQFIWDGQNTYGGKYVTNPSGGLFFVKGHPLGATGLAQCAELTWQLRGQADKRQSRRGQGRASAQPRSGRRLRHDDVRARLTRRFSSVARRRQVRRERSLHFIRGSRLALAKCFAAASVCPWIKSSQPKIAAASPARGELPM